MLTSSTPPVSKSRPLPAAIPQGAWQVKSWSYSTLIKYERCPKIVYFNKVEKIAETYGPAAERGSSIHREIEMYMSGETDLYPPQLIDRPYWFGHFEELKKDPSLLTEDAWAFDREWRQVAYRGDDTAWLRLAIDLSTYDQNGKTAKYIDVKTGAYQRNEIKHTQQLFLYAVAGFRKYPALESIDLELWYVDHDRIKLQSITRREARIVEDTYMTRSNRLLTDRTFIPQPSRFNCSYCSYKEICNFAWSKSL